MSQLLVSALFASAMTGLNATTTANADNGKRPISLLFGRNPNARQVGADEPLNSANRPHDSFETAASAAALNGQNYTSIEQINFQWYLRSSVRAKNAVATSAQVGQAPVRVRIPSPAFNFSLCQNRVILKECHTPATRSTSRYRSKMPFAAY
jgi:hypothetical protein